MPKQYEFLPDEPIEASEPDISQSANTSGEQTPLLSDKEIEMPFDEKKFDRFNTNISYLNYLARQVYEEQTDVIPEELQGELKKCVYLVLADLSIADKALKQKDYTYRALESLHHLAHITKDYPIDFSELHNAAASAIKILGNNIEYINEIIDEKQDHISHSALLALITVRDLGTTYYKHQASDALKGRVDMAEEFINDDFSRRADLLELLFTYGSKKQIIRWFNEVSKRFNEHNFDRFEARHAIASLFESNDEKALNYGKALVRKILHEYNLPAADMLAAWHASTEKKELPYIVSRNLETIHTLEFTRPGIVERLQEECGVNDVSRYPTTLLIEQDAHLDDKESPYGILLYSYSDNNGALYQTSGALDQLFTQLHGGYQLRVLEVKDKLDFIKKLRRLKRKHGYTHKGSFGIVAGHGSPQGVHFNEPAEKKDRLHIEDLADPRIHKTSEFFEDGATLILISCETGTAQGLAQKFTETTGLKLIAPNKPTNIRSINARIKNGKLDFDVHYIDEESARVYVKGDEEMKQNNEESKN